MFVDIHCRLSTFAKYKIEQHKCQNKTNTKTNNSIKNFKFINPETNIMNPKFSCITGFLFKREKKKRKILYLFF